MVGIAEATKISEKFYRNLYAEASTKMANSESSDLNLLQTVREILSSRSGFSGLKPAEVAVLLRSLRLDPQSEVRNLIINESRNLRKRSFGSDVAVMVPIEISSYCMSNCEFCGWRSGNRKMLRLKISERALVKQASFLAGLGFSHFEIASGDDLNYIKNDLADDIKVLKRTVSEITPESRISICLTPLHESHYRLLASAGLDTVLTWQETYHRPTFERHITAGPKAKGITADFKVDAAGEGCHSRMRSHESAIRAGLQVGIGVMIGLAPDPETDILAVVIHGQKLIEAYRDGIKPLIIGMPTWNPITTPETDNRGKHEQPFNVEQNFELIAAIYLLSFPDRLAWVFPNCRVSRETQVAAINTAGAFTSTMVRVGPGAYLDMKDSCASNLFDRSSTPAEELTLETVLAAEQFVHHFDLHERYISEFKASGLRIVTDHSLIETAGAN